MLLIFILISFHPGMEFPGYILFPRGPLVPIGDFVAVPDGTKTAPKGWLRHKLPLYPLSLAWIYLSA